MSFDEYGFLGDYGNKIVKYNYENHIKVFKICEEINNYAQNIKYAFKINGYDIQGLLAISLFGKVLNTFQTAVILYKYGLSSQSKMITRVQLESLFILKSIVKDKQNIDKLKKSIDKRRELLLKDINKNTYSVFNEFLEEDLIEEYRDLKEKNKKSDAMLISPKEWAIESESYYEYFLAYNQLSKDIHLDLLNLEQYINFDDEGNVESFNIQPDTKDIKVVLLHTAGHAMVQAIHCMSKYCSLDNESVIEVLFRKARS